MRVGCVICSDSFASFIDVATIPCGHTFHTHCLLQWIEKSKSCPTCRHKATSKSVLKLYFDATTNLNSQVDPDSLQNQIDSLKFQVVEKTQIIKTISEENSDFKKQTKELRDEVIRLEKYLKERSTTIAAYKEQVQHMDTLVKNASRAEEEAKNAKSQLKLLKEIKILLDENSSEIEETVSSNSNGSNSLENIKNLATISCVLKSRVNKLLEEKRRHLDENHALASKLKDTKKNLSKSDDKLLELQKEFNLQREDLQALERDNQSLQKKICKLQEAVDSPSADVKNSIIQRLISESPVPVEFKKRGTYQREEFDLTPEITRKVRRTLSVNYDASTPNGTSSQVESEASPYLQVKSASIGALKLPPLSTTNKSIPLKGYSSLFKDERNTSLHSLASSKSKSRTGAPINAIDDVGYDGMGGHHAVDYFPVPNLSRVYPSSKKKPQKSVKIVTAKGPAQISSKTLKDFFKDTFAED